MQIPKPNFKGLIHIASRFWTIQSKTYNTGQRDFDIILFLLPKLSLQSPPVTWGTAPS